MELRVRARYRPLPVCVDVQECVCLLEIYDLISVSCGSIMVENKGLVRLAFGRHCSERLSGEFREPVSERECQVFLKGEPQPLSLQEEYHTLCAKQVPPGTGLAMQVPPGTGLATQVVPCTGLAK